MKQLLALAILFSLFSVNAALAAPGNLVGTWSIDAKCLLIADNGVTGEPGVIADIPQKMVITWQGQGFFKGFSCDPAAPNDGISFGVIDGKKIHATDWATTMSGTLNGQGDIMEFIIQNLPGSPENVPGICMGTARKISDIVDCALAVVE